MKVLFTGSPRAFETSKKEHVAIYDSIKKMGHTHVSDFVIKTDPEKFYKSDSKQITDNYKELMGDLANADVLVVEISVHSMSLGFLINKALEMGKPVISLYTKDHQPFLFAGIENDKYQGFEYSLSNIHDILKEAFDYAQNIVDTRFNFLISPSLLNYLDWIAKNRRIPRSVYLRRLIEADRDRNKDYKG